jgi:antitoxin component of MazEF toxin-antitoxin module
MIRLTSLSRNGNSLCVTVPIDLLTELKWLKGEHLVCRALDGELAVRRADEGRMFAPPPAPPRVKIQRKRKR